MCERKIEKELVAQVKAMGGIAPKFTSPGFDVVQIKLTTASQGIDV